MFPKKQSVLTTAVFLKNMAPTRIVIPNTHTRKYTNTSVGSSWEELQRTFLFPVDAPPLILSDFSAICTIVFH